MVVPHPEARTSAKGRRSKLTGSSEEQAEKFVIAGPRLHQIHVDHTLALCDKQVEHAVQDGERRISRDRLFRRVVNRPSGNVVLRKKLLRVFAALSPTAVVSPLERNCH